MLYQIYDKVFDKIIARDEVVFTKRSPRCISFDNKYFFNQDSERFDITETENEEIIKLDEQFVNENYHIIHWREQNHHPLESVFRDFTIEELDKEVKNIVFALNKIPFVHTTGSCCDHGVSPLWVDMIIHNFSSLLFIVNLITNDKNDDFFDIIIRKNENKIERQKSIFIEIRTKQEIVGEEAYKLADKIADYIESYYNECK